MKLLYYFSRVKKELNILLLIAIIVYFFIELWLVNYDEIFHGAYKIGQFFSNLAIAYISSFIFYFVVIHIKDVDDKQNINEFVGLKVFGIITCAHLLIIPLQRKFNPSAQFKYLKPIELQDLLKKINRNSKEAPYSVMGEKFTWLGWYVHLKQETQIYIDKILIYQNYLDSKLIQLLNRVNNSLFMTQFDVLYDFSHDNSLNIFSMQIQSYLDLISDIEAYANKNLKENQHMTSAFLGNPLRTN